MLNFQLFTHHIDCFHSPILKKHAVATKVLNIVKEVILMKEEMILEETLKVISEDSDDDSVRVYAIHAKTDH